MISEQTQSQINRIIEAADKSTLTFFVGAGVSRVSNVPLWTDLIAAFDERLTGKSKSKYSSEELLAIPQKYYYANPTEYYTIVKNLILNDSYEPNILHDMMLALQPNCFVTTNFDTLLEKAASKNSCFYNLVVCDKDIPNTIGANYILKVHGDISKNNFVLKEEDYLDYSENFKLIETLLKSIFATSVVVFVGYGLNDYNIKLVLNWVKALLGDEFRPPLFLHTDDDELGALDQAYNNKRGLDVIDAHAFNTINDDTRFFARYYKFLELLLEGRNESKLNLQGLTEDLAFDRLYELFRPFDSLPVLRKDEIICAFKGQVRIDIEGDIILTKENTLLFKKFLQLYEVYQNSKEIDQIYAKKFLYILDVLQKAGIDQIMDPDHPGKPVFLEREARQYIHYEIVRLDYFSMNRYVKRPLKDYRKKYKQAYFNALLGDFDTAFQLYSEVATIAYEKKDYVLLYFTQINQLRTYRIIKNINRRYMEYSPYIKTLDENRKLIMDNMSEESIFNRLPYDVRQQYSSLKQLYTTEELYKHASDAHTNASKLNSVTDSYSVEMGRTSSGKTINFIHELLDFSISNHIITIGLSRFSFSIRISTEALLHKYRVQEIPQIRSLHPFGMNRDKITIDHVDFYCLIEHFTLKELENAFAQERIKDLHFSDLAIVQNTIRDFLKFFRQHILHKPRNPKELSFVERLHKIMYICRHIELPIDIVEDMVCLLLANNFFGITIDDKIKFIYHQVVEKKQYSKRIQTAIINCLCEHVNENLQKKIEQQEYNLPASKSNRINYYVLASYISSDSTYISTKLSVLVEKMLPYATIDDLYIILNFFFPRIQKKIRKRVLELTNDTLAKSFNFKLFSAYLSNVHNKLLDKVENLLIDYLETNQSNNLTEKANGLMFQSTLLDEFSDIGFWCMLGWLDRKKYHKYASLSPSIEFFMDPVGFDYEKFELSWVLDWTKACHKALSENSFVKQNVQQAILRYLCDNELHKSEYNELVSILLQYYV